MSATSELRRMLDELGVHYMYRGRYTTAVPVGDALWYAVDRYDGTLKVNLSGYLSPAQVAEAITGPYATMTSTCDEDGAGSSECGACGRTVGKHFRFCPWCGAKFVRQETGR